MHTPRARHRIPAGMSPFVLLVLLASAGASGADVTDEKPNIIYIMADDLGYGDLGCYGQQKIRTPNLDRMAAEGMRFTDHYSGSSVCAPSRCVLMTGLHTGHARVRANGRMPIEPEDVTVAEVLKRAGYATGAMGKWSLGDAGTTGAATRQGFDYFFGYLNQGAAHFYYPESLDRNEETVTLEANRDGKRGTYSHDLLTQEALEFIRRSAPGPFFLYVPYTIPHAEVLVPEDSLAEYRDKWPEKPFPGGHYAAQPTPRAARAAMITRLDRDVGCILELVDELGVDERTIVMFTSDNGPCTAGGQDPAFFESAGPLRGLKFGLYEGGIRVPMIARWPGKIPAGSVTDFASGFWDIMPTCAELAGEQPPAGIDGVSLAPTLMGKPREQAGRECLYWEHRGWQAVRFGNWKAIRTRPQRPIELYDLKSDVGEETDLAAAKPDLAAKAERYFETSRTDDPNWPLKAKGR
ncbi:arylsulfatase [Planctomycetota bacterium]